MKKKIDQLITTIILLILMPLNLIGQESEWYEFELENIKIEFPSKEVYQLDTIVDGIRLNQLYTQIENSTFILQRLPAENSTRNKNLSSLPYNHESLIEYYNEVIDGAKNSYKSEKVKKQKINFGELIGYESIFYDDRDKPIIESRTYLAGKDLIMVSVYNPETGINEIKNTFFNSLNLDKINSLEQYIGKPKAYRQGYVFGKLFFYLLIGLGIFFLIKTFRKKKINWLQKSV